MGHRSFLTRLLFHAVVSNTIVVLTMMVCNGGGGAKGIDRQ
jgi:hypothetical protein